MLALLQGTSAGMAFAGVIAGVVALASGIVLVNGAMDLTRRREGPLTPADSLLPLRGRWLGCLFAALLLPLACLWMCAGMAVLVISAVALVAALAHHGG